MFNDRYVLTKAVLEGRKTMTRRIIPLTDADRQYLDTAFDFDFREMVIIDRYSMFKVGEDVAVAQSYRYVYDTMEEHLGNNKANEWWFKAYDVLGNQFGPATTPGYNNKLFVRADLMPYRIRITNIKVELLQDITEQDCICEGIKIKKGNRNGERPFGEFTFDGWDDYSFTAREAFAALIDRISGRGTWQSNPYVFAYSFELIR